MSGALGFMTGLHLHEAAERLGGWNMFHLLNRLFHQCLLSELHFQWSSRSAPRCRLKKGLCCLVVENILWKMSPIWCRISQKSKVIWSWYFKFHQGKCSSKAIQLLAGLLYPPMFPRVLYSNVLCFEGYTEIKGWFFKHHNYKKNCYGRYSLFEAPTLCFLFSLLSKQGLR